ncbi:MAG TPA: hypothetical protein PLZ11_15925, partial [Thauera sp.]|nr:hypothetical protein [Thauera sp.]
MSGKPISLHVEREGWLVLRVGNCGLQFAGAVAFRIPSVMYKKPTGRMCGPSRLTLWRLTLHVAIDLGTALDELDRLHLHALLER